MKPLAIFLYEYSGKSAEPFAQAGWDCVCIDTQHERTWSDGTVTYVKADARHWKPTRDQMERCQFFAAFPPCDHLAVCGAKWFKGKGLYLLAQSIELFAVAADWMEFFDAPGFIENPVSTISTYWRKSDYRFNPCDFTEWEPRDNYTKKTCLWAHGEFVMPQAARDYSLGAPDDRIHKAKPGPNRKNERSATPAGFMRAVFDANFSDRARVAA